MRSRPATPLPPFRFQVLSSSPQIVSGKSVLVVGCHLACWLPRVIQHHGPAKTVRVVADAPCTGVRSGVVAPKDVEPEQYDTAFVLGGLEALGIPCDPPTSNNTQPQADRDQLLQVPSSTRSDSGRAFPFSISSASRREDSGAEKGVLRLSWVVSGSGLGVECGGPFPIRSLGAATSTAEPAYVAMSLHAPSQRRCAPTVPAMLHLNVSVLHVIEHLCKSEMFNCMTAIKTLLRTACNCRREYGRPTEGSGDADLRAVGQGEGQDRATAVGLIGGGWRVTDAANGG